MGGGQITFSFSGDAGPDYIVQASTNLESTNWLTVLTTNAPTLPFTFVDTNLAEFPSRYYRVGIIP
jgi:hypothetical protein